MNAFLFKCAFREPLYFCAKAAQLIIPISNRRQTNSSLEVKFIATCVTTRRHACTHARNAISTKRVITIRLANLAIARGGPFGNFDPRGCYYGVAGPGKCSTRIQGVRKFARLSLRPDYRARELHCVIDTWFFERSFRDPSRKNRVEKIIN